MWRAPAAATHPFAGVRPWQSRSAARVKNGISSPVKELRHFFGGYFASAFLTMLSIFPPSFAGSC